MKTLYLIDGHAQFFRAYHAIRTRMSSPVTMEPTNATFGFSGMLLKLLRQAKPDYLALVTDKAGDRETFRSEIYPEYKANREAPPEDLAPQVRRCVSLADAAGIPVYAEEGVEADDVIASLVEEVKRDHPDLKIRIVSKDKDLQQLLSDRVEMYDVHTGEVIDVATLKEAKHIAPDQVVDLLALMGDSIDNIPGVEGVGPKTAAQLIEKYGTVENLLAHADEIKGKRGERLREAADWLPVSKQLVTLKSDVAVQLDLERADVAALKPEQLEPIFRELGFNRHVDDLRKFIEERGGAAPKKTSGQSGDGFAPGLFEAAAPKPATDADYTIVRTESQLATLAKTLGDAEIVAFDAETTHLSAMRCDLCGFSFSAKAGSGWYVPMRSPDPESHLCEETVLTALRPLLEDASIAKCGHNLKYDILALRRAGVHLRGVVFDSMVASYIIDSSRSSHSLDALALALLNHSCMPIRDLIGSGKSQRTFDQAPLEQAGPYAAEDADIALRLFERMVGEIKEMGLGGLFKDVEMPLVDVLAELQWNGVLVDPDELDRQAERLKERIDALRAQIEDASPHVFSPDSPKQLAAALFNKPDHDEAPGLGLKPVKRTKTGYSTDIEVLEKLAADPEIETPVPGLIVEYRQLSKLVNTYLVALKEAIHPETGRIHASFNQTVAATGRLSSSEPNLQNIPIRTDIGREIRKAFVAPEGRVFVSADYSQIELRVLAHLSQDEALTEAFQRGEDIHTSVAAQINGVAIEDVTSQQRSAAKMVNFGIVYGVTPWGLARRLGIERDEASKIIDEYKQRFPRITVFLQECIEHALTHGYVETILKRRRPIPQIESRQPQTRSLGERMAINSVVQGSAADLIKVAMVDLHDRLQDESMSDVKMLLQIHDELLFETPQERGDEVRDLVAERMEHAMDLAAPLEVECGVAANWYDCK